VLRRLVPCVVLSCLLAPLIVASPPVSAGARVDVLDPTLTGVTVAGDDPTAVLNAVVAVEGPTTLDLYRTRRFAIGDTSPKARRALDEILVTVAARQAPVRFAIERSGAAILSTYDTAYNGFLIQATHRQLESIARTPGVRLIYRAPEWAPDLRDAVPFVGADRVYDTLGYGGAGVRIAVIDTGIDYFHRSLGGAGRAADFADDDPAVIETGSFPTQKVVGGYDFAGTRYNAAAANAADRRPTPDSDPRDETGHGTHVAGIAAGERGVSGVYHGAAPDAEIIGLKVFGRADQFGRPGTTVLANDGIEWAIEANLGRAVKGVCQRDVHNLCRVDVINMSVGSTFAGRLPEATEFVRRATQAGIVVIGSSGNAGDVAFVTGSPGAAPYALSVANTVPPGERTDKVEATYDGGAHDVEALEAEATLAKQMDGQHDVRGDLVDFGRACPGDPAGGDVQRKIALIDGRDCAFQVKLQAAKAAGAVAALVFNTSESIYRMQGQGQAVEIPAYMIKKSDADDLKVRLGGGTRVSIRLVDDFRDSLVLDWTIDTIADSSSRGPSRGGALKPDLAAPGTNISAPRMGSGREALLQSGTSMATPLVAGGAALVIERARREGLAPADRPLGTGGTVGPLDIAALLVNYATAPVWVADSRKGRPAPLALGGVGRMQVDKAARGKTLVRAGAIASLSFGVRALSAPVQETQALTVRNLGATTRRYQIEVRFLMADDVGKGVTYTLSSSELEVAAGASTPVELTVHVDPSALKPWRVAGGDRLLSGASGAMTDAEMDALVVVTEVDASGATVPDGDVVHVPVYFLPRAASDLALTATPVRVDEATGRGTATFTNRGAGAGRAELFVLLAADAVETSLDPRLNLDYVGARVIPGVGAGRTLELAVHTVGAAAIPHEVQAQVWLDTNRDGKLDWLLFNADPPLLAGQLPTGQQYSLARDVASTSPLALGTHTYRASADVDISSRALMLRMDAALLGYTAGSPIAFNAVIVIVPGIDDVRGDVATMRGFDAAPDDGWTGTGPGAGRLHFDASALAFGLDRWTVAVAGGATETVGVTMPALVPPDAGRRLLAVYPVDAAGEGDAEIVLVEAIGPPTPSPTPTLAPIATLAPEPTVPPAGAGPVFLPLLARKAGM
jgi:minor extracellular serine protease Vpr